MTKAQGLLYEKMGRQVGLVYNKLFHDSRDATTEVYQIISIETIIFRPKLSFLDLNYVFEGR